MDIRPAVDDDRPVVRIGGVAELRRVECLPRAVLDRNGLMIGLIVPFIARDENGIIGVALKQTALFGDRIVRSFFGAMKNVLSSFYLYINLPYFRAEIKQNLQLFNFLFTFLI